MSYLECSDDGTVDSTKFQDLVKKANVKLNKEKVALC